MDFNYVELTAQLDLPRIEKLNTLRRTFTELHLLNGEYKIQCYLGVLTYDAVTEDTLEHFRDVEGLIYLLYSLSPQVLAPKPRLSAFKTYQLACSTSDRTEALYKHLQALGTRRREYSTLSDLINTAQNIYHYRLPKSVFDCLYTETVTEKAIYDLKQIVPDDAWSYNCDMTLWIKERNAK